MVKCWPEKNSIFYVFQTVLLVFRNLLYPTLHPNTERYLKSSVCQHSLLNDASDPIENEITRSVSIKNVASKWLTEFMSVCTCGAMRWYKMLTNTYNWVSQLKWLIFCQSVFWRNKLYCNSSYPIIIKAEVRR